MFKSFQPFSGVFLVDPWKPDARHSAQQGMFLCAANTQIGFVANLAASRSSSSIPARARLLIPGKLREEVLHRLAVMNLTASTLFPDLGGLARSLRTHAIRLKEPFRYVSSAKGIL